MESVAYRENSTSSSVLADGGKPHGDKALLKEAERDIYRYKELKGLY